MSPRTPPTAQQELAQPPLIAMTPEEVTAAGRKLAELIRERTELKNERAAARADMKAQRELLDQEIAALASTIRSHGR